MNNKEETRNPWQATLVELGREAAAEYRRRNPHATADEAATYGMLYAMQIFADNPKANAGLMAEAVAWGIETGRLEG